MNRLAKQSFWTIVFGIIILSCTGLLSAQKSRLGPVATLWEDTAINPHDFTNEYYVKNGVSGRDILNRRNGFDGLSTFGNSSNPIHRNIRVTATVPAYDESGNMLFWYPLGEVAYDGFTPDSIGSEIKEIADRFPIYVFPNYKLEDPRYTVNTRQAALMDNSWFLIIGQDLNLNPLGIRQIFFVNFTAKAFTKEGSDMMNYMSKKNGLGADDTPVLSSMEDLRVMIQHELITTTLGTDISKPTYAIAPMLTDPTNGVIAKDAFLMFATKDGTPLPSESIFSRQFSCLQKTGQWCKE